MQLQSQAAGHVNYHSAGSESPASCRKYAVADYATSLALDKSFLINAQAPLHPETGNGQESAQKKPRPFIFVSNRTTHLAKKLSIA
jgi:hypothetical protein